MKKTIFLFIFMLFVVSIKAQWNQHVTGQTQIINDISVIDDNVIWVKDQTRQSISYTTDGGVNWTTKTLPANIYENCGGFCAVSATTAYIVVCEGEKGIYKTTNSADTWVLQPTGFNASSSFPDFVYFWNENEGVAVGDAYPNQNFEIYTTSNGGEKWNLVPTSNMPNGEKQWSLNSNSYFRVHGNTFYFMTDGFIGSRIYKSTNKGLNWTVINTPESVLDYCSFDFKDDNNGVLAYADNNTSTYRQYITSDGGLTWTSVPVTNISDIYYLPSKNVYFSTNPRKGLSYSADNGQNWIQNPSFLNVGVSGVATTPSGKTILGGWGYVYTSNNYTGTNLSLNNIKITGANKLDITFDRNVESISAQNTANYKAYYTMKPDTATKQYSFPLEILSVTLDATNKSLVHLVTQAEMPNDTIAVRVLNVKGTDGYPIINNGASAYGADINTYSTNNNNTNQTYFSDNFDNGLGNFTTYDVDGLKPAAGVSNVFGTAAPYKAWVINGNKVISTSWYEPAGRSNDWLVTTAPINIQSASTYLTWKAAAYDGTYRDGYQVYISTTGNKISDFTTPVLTIAKENSSWTTRAIDLASYVGQSIYIAFVNNSTDQYILGLDDIFVGGTNFSVVDQTEQYIYTSSTKVKGNIVNNGIPITSFTAKYTAHSQTYTKIYTGLNIAAGATYSFEIPDLITVNGAGETTLYTLEITVGDTKKTSSGSVSMASFKPDKKVIAEEATGTWCGWCPRGAVFLKTVSEKYPASFIGIAVHNGDPMTNAVYDTGIGSKISGYPSALIDRKQVIDPSQFEDYYLNALTDFCPASLTLTGVFTDATRKNVELKVKTKYNINYSANANYRIAFVVTENNVKGTITGYNQSNYYSGGGNGVMGGFEALSNPVPAAQMVYEDVAREIYDTFNGIAGSVPTTIVNNETLEYNRTIAIPASVMNLSEVSFIAMLIDANTGQIKNADRIKASDLGTTSVESPESDNLSLKIIKVNSEIIVNFVSEPQNLLSVSLYGIDGKLIYKSKTNNDYNSTYRIPDAGLKGIYIIKVETSSRIISKKIVL